MRCYDSYKASGVPWLGEVPSHWYVERAKWVHTYKKEMNDRRQCANILSLTLRGVVNNDADNPEGLVPKDYSTYQIFEKYDLVFKLIDLENFKTSRVGLVHERGIMSPAYVRVQPGPDQNPRYHYYYYFSLYQQGIYNKLGAGVRSTLGPRDLLELGALVPPRDEQDRIVNFLDQKTAEIDTAIAKKERLIELLQEQKRILINQAVTNGLNPDVPMRDSGMPWIGEMPKHWHLKPLKRVTAFSGGGTPNKSNAAFWGGEIPWVSPKDMKTLEIAGSQDTITELALRKSSTKLISSEAVLVVVRGMILARTFPVSVNTIPVTINQDMKALTPTSEVDSYFLRDYLAGMTAHILDLTEESGHGTKTLPTEKLGSFPIALPPIAEQTAIRDFCKRVAERVEKLSHSVQIQINNLVELKRLVVASATAGKIRI